MTTWRSRLSARMTYANIVSTVCLFLVVSGGTAFAAKALIDGRNLKNGSVSAAKIGNNAVTGAKIKNGSIEATDLSAKARAALKGATGSAGKDGAAGKDGVAGAQGTKGEKGDPGSGGGASTINALDGTGCTRPNGGVGTLSVALTETGESVTITCVGGVIWPQWAAADATEPNDNSNPHRLTELETVLVGGVATATKENLTIHATNDQDRYTLVMDCAGMTWDDGGTNKKPKSVRFKMDVAQGTMPGGFNVQQANFGGGGASPNNWSTAYDVCDPRTEETFTITVNPGELSPARYSVAVEINQWQGAD